MSLGWSLVLPAGCVEAMGLNVTRLFEKTLRGDAEIVCLERWKFSKSRALRLPMKSGAKSIIGTDFGNVLWFGEKKALSEDDPKQMAERTWKACGGKATRNPTWQSARGTSRGLAA